MNLTAEEIRVLGCLVEKEATTPDVYPLSTNGLVTACNQRSSRDPVVDYDEDSVKAAMISLRERGLARTVRGEGSRVYKHAHSLPSALQLDRPELAVLSVLMLRGPQTAGELRTRTERQYAFPSLDAVDDVLVRLADRDAPLVRQLPRSPGRKEARWEQTLASADEAGPAPLPVAPTVAAEHPPADRLGALAAEVASLHRELSALRARVDALERP
jgi:uncharacterized protein YceH (UPF0502 family)